MHVPSARFRHRQRQTRQSAISHRDVLLPVRRGVDPLLEPPRRILHRVAFDPVERDVRLGPRRVDHLAGGRKVK